jgi:hypothetical protein
MKENPGYFFFNRKCSTSGALYDFIISLIPKNFANRYRLNQPIPIEDFYYISNIKNNKIPRGEKAICPEDILFQGKNQEHIHSICAPLL